jgi:hypothetical protein
MADLAANEPPRFELVDSEAPGWGDKDKRPDSEDVTIGCDFVAPESRHHRGCDLMPIVPRVAGQLTRSRNAVTRHRHAKRSLERTGSARSRHGLDWLNFFTADVEAGFGAFVSFYLAD